MVQKYNFYEGFWKSKEEPKYPEPISNDTIWFKNNKKLIISKLQKIQSIVKPKAYKGSSLCRLCGCKNGSEEYSVATPDNAKVIWTWPSGFIHYIEEHNVCPTEDFLNNVLGINKQIKTFENIPATVKTVKALLLMMSLEERNEIFEFLKRGKEEE